MKIPSNQRLFETDRLELGPCLLERFCPTWLQYTHASSPLFDITWGSELDLAASSTLHDVEDD